VDEERLRLAFEPATLDYYRRFLLRLMKHCRLPGRQVLDIGCGTGQFLTVAREEGWDVSGLEIGRASTTYANDTLGLNVTCGSLYDYQGDPESLDAISMIEVIEHLEQPTKALQKSHELLRKDGLLLVTTPNFDSLYRRLFGNRWWVINCEDEHIVFFTLDTLAGMLQENGFEVVDWHIQGMDMLGILREFRQKESRDDTAANHSLPDQAGDDATEPDAAVCGYYESRSAKNRVKALLGKIGLLALVRLGLRTMDQLFSQRWSPFFAMGEQLVVVARKKN